MTTAEIIQRARDLLHDNGTGTAQIWSDPQLCRWGTDGIMEIRKIRYDAVLDDAGTEITFVKMDATATEANLCIADAFCPALVDYIVHRSFFQDAEDADHLKRANAFYQSWKERIQR